MALPAGRKGIRADQVNPDGTINVDTDPYVLPIASSEVLGGIKVGEGVSIGEDGTLSVAASSEFAVFEISERISSITANTPLVGSPFQPPAGLVGKKIVGVSSVDTSGYVSCIGVCRSSAVVSASDWLYPVYLSPDNYTQHNVTVKIIAK